MQRDDKGGNIKTTAITPRYRDLFQNMRDWDRNRADAAYDAVLFDRKLAVAALIEQYQRSESDEMMRYLCVQLIGFSESKKSIPTLILALDDPSAIVRREACFALEDMRAFDAIGAIEKRCNDLDPNVRNVAEEAYQFLMKRR